MNSRFSILIANGVNLDLLGTREPSIYGNKTLADLESLLIKESKQLSRYFSIPNIELDFFQSNNESEYLEKISEPYDAAILNPGAWTHTSLALGDRLAGLKLSFIEVHLSNLTSRDAIRQRSFCQAHAQGVIFGLGLDTYTTGLYALLEKTRSRFSAR